MCGLAGFVSASGPSARDAVQRMTERTSPAAPMARVCGWRQALSSAIVALPSSIWMLAPISPWCRPVAVTPLSSTEKSTTSANCAVPWRRTAPPSAPRPIPKSCWHCSPVKASVCCPDCAGCLPLPSGMPLPRAVSRSGPLRDQASLLHSDAGGAPVCLPSQGVAGVLAGIAGTRVGRAGGILSLGVACRNRGRCSATSSRCLLATGCGYAAACLTRPCVGTISANTGK